MGVFNCKMAGMITFLTIAKWIKRERATSAERIKSFKGD